MFISVSSIWTCSLIRAHVNVDYTNRIANRITWIPWHCCSRRQQHACTEHDDHNSRWPQHCASGYMRQHHWLIYYIIGQHNVYIMCHRPRCRQHHCLRSTSGGGAWNFGYRHAFQNHIIACQKPNSLLRRSDIFHMRLTERLTIICAIRYMRIFNVHSQKWQLANDIWYQKLDIRKTRKRINYKWA